MKNKKLTLHFFGVSAFIIFIVLGLACASTQKPETVVQSEVTGSPGVTKEMYKDGQIHQANIIEKRDFTTLGLIFVESSADFDSNGRITNGSKITYEMLMKEAQKLGADDIINIKIDEIHIFTEAEEIKMVSYQQYPMGDNRMGQREEKVITVSKTIEYKANALAIKYVTK